MTEIILNLWYFVAANLNDDHLLEISFWTWNDKKIQTFSFIIPFKVATHFDESYLINKNEKYAIEGGDFDHPVEMGSIYLFSQQVYFIQ